MLFKMFKIGVKFLEMHNYWAIFDIKCVRENWENFGTIFSIKSKKLY